MAAMMSQTRCDLALVLCDGRTYAVPSSDQAPPRARQPWADDSHAEYLDVVVVAGTIVSGAAVRGGSLVACDMYGVRVLVPCEVLEDVN
jgi:hypothetical protein